MPRLNVARVLRSRCFASRLDVVQRAVTVGANGLMVVSETALDPKPVGVVVQGSPKGMTQEPDSSYTGKAIIVYVYQARLYDITMAQAPNSQRQPDLVVYKGNRYVVRAVYDWSDWGAGWYAADCELLDVETAHA